ncbi:MAG: DISARM system helicase DrmA, partial [Cyanobacteria bacterium]|nr:DISARM system helicase DrmA [Cyanobacteriota bacterium]
MKIINLPSVLTTELNLVEINQQLRDRTARLDWTGVVSAPAAVLDVLLAGLDLSDDADVLDINNPTLSDTLIDQLVACSDRVSGKATKTAKTAQQKRRKGEDSAPAPALWTAPEVPQPEPPIAAAESLSQQTAAAPPDESQGASAIPAAVPSTRVFSVSSPAALRQQLEERILKDLHGPVGGETEEVDEAHVTDRYLVGMLAPRIRNPEAEAEANTAANAETEATLEDQPELQDDLAIADTDNPEEGSPDANIPATDSMFPCSMGMTFCVSAQAEAIAVQVQWGCYQRQPSDILQTDKGNPKAVWKRQPYAGTVTLALDPNQAIDEVPLPDLAPSVYLRGQMRRLPDGDWLINLFLVNGQQEPNQNKDSAWLFQPKLQVTAAEAQTPDIFIRKPLHQDAAALDPHIHAENQAMAMLYRHQVEFAVGHGVAVHAETATDNPIRAIALSTQAVPRYEVAATKPPTVLEIPALAGLVLDMKRLAEASDETLPTLLHPLTTAYAQWIDTQAQKIQDPSQGLGPYRAEAETAISNCRRTLTRIQAGIATLTQNPQAAQAFRFMNRAMWQQRLHSAYAECQRRGHIAITLEELDIPEKRSWYPFQLAFILLNLPSTTDLAHPDRAHPTDAIADLLWFPTGGGKTEAYLGLTAYTIGLRRLQGTVAGRDGMHGVAVLMRYTLRLLTLQQFQRATTLICACETIRRTDEATWGNDPFRIGLWVGANNTPNTTDDSDEAIKQYRDSRLRGRGTPHQLTNCPWCGSKLEPGRDIKVETYKKGRGRTLVKCSDPLGHCAFAKGDGLPIVVVDEEIYRCLPTLLIATVDKFAQMPWKGEVQMLFGQVNGYCDRHGFRSPDLEDADRHPKVGQHPAAKTTSHPKLRPPDLIIQDELHLISGPLGTLVGLYETAVDELCTWEVNGQSVRPKVIASTATIRQAQTQVHHLFLRQLSIFPPPGLDIQDNFFSRQRPTTETPGRRYLGICAPGRRLKATMIRIYLAVL